MSVIKKSCSGRSDCDGMDDDSDDKDSKRKSRNLSEKKRRDQFNVLVNELSTMVSTGSGRKMDKSTVLKATIAFLKNHNEIAVRSRVHEIQENWKPSFLTNEEFTHLVLEAVDGFMIALGSNAGEILYISEGITSLLGYLPADVVGTTIYELGCEEEQNDLYNIITSPSDDERSVSFSCHIRRSNDDTKITPSYDLVHFIGYFRADCEMVTTDSSRYSGYSGDADNRVVFVGTGRLQIPHLLSEMRLLDTYSLPSLSTNPTLTITSSSCSPSRTPSLSSHTSHSHSASRSSEFISRHSLEWKFLYLDQRAPPIIGYLPIELLGTSGYDYYHVDDLERVVGCHDALLQKGEGTSCCYRFLTKGQQWLWLQTRFYITYHQWNSKPEFVVCTHRVVSYVDVLRQNRKQEDSLEILGDPLPLPENSTSLPWYNNKNTHNTKSHSKALSLSGFNHQHGASSDCTSMSADSPISRHSGRTQISTKSKTSHGLHSSSTSNLNLPTQSSSPSSVILPSPLTTITTTTTGNNCCNTGNSTVGVTVTSGTSSTDGFIEPATQYVTGIAAGVVVRHEPSSGLLQQCYDGRRGAQQREEEELSGGGVVRVTVGEQLPQVGDHFSMSIQHHHNDDQHTVQMQADLQRKHAELQAIIGQQQAELRRVSEQLLMSRLGILHQATSQATTHTTSTCYSAGAVSSTTSLTAPPVTPANTSPLSPVLSLATTTATATHTPSILHSAPVYTTRNQQVDD